MTVLSPHLDDAVLSLGQHLAASRDDLEKIERVVTVFAGKPQGLRMVTAYDQSCGFGSSRRAVESRRDEDVAALKVLGCHPQHLSELDNQYRSRAVHDPRMVDRIAQQCRQYMSGKEHVFVPLGIGHPDHRILADACELAARTLIERRPVSLMFYEEMPYRVLYPEHVAARLVELRELGWHLDLWPLQVGDIEIKSQAIACYKSQFPEGAADPCLRVPERVWRAWQ